MINRKIMRSLLESMEHAAEETLQRDSAFHKALIALKSEIDNDPVVQARVGELIAQGRSVHKSFVPHIKVRVRTDEGIFALPRPAQVPAVEPAGRLIQGLRNAVGMAIKNSPTHRQLESLVNEVVGADNRFEGIAAQIESAGYEVLLCLDLSAYAQVQGATWVPQQTSQPNASSREEALPIRLTVSDRKFLAAMKISIQGGPPGT